jgi:GTP-binding protein
VPCGTLIYDLETNSPIADMVNHEDELLLCNGGRGGLGNLKYKSSTNRSPTKFTEGKKGDDLTLRLELRLLADIGLLGKPNAGKSSLVRAVSSAKPKVADYAFTTLHPSLGVVDYSSNSSFVISDIPGLIAGASKGVGLGIQFLKHLARTRVIVQIVDIYDKSLEEIIGEIEELNVEIKDYDSSLVEKVKWLALNKVDLIADQDLDGLVHELKVKYEGIFNIYCISAAKKIGTQQLMREIGTYIESFDE